MRIEHYGKKCKCFINVANIELEPPRTFFGCTPNNLRNKAKKMDTFYDGIKIILLAKF